MGSAATQLAGSASPADCQVLVAFVTQVPSGFFSTLTRRANLKLRPSCFGSENNTSHVHAGESGRLSQREATREKNLIGRKERNQIARIGKQGLVQFSSARAFSSPLSYAAVITNMASTNRISNACFRCLRAPLASSSRAVSSRSSSRIASAAFSTSSSNAAASDSAEAPSSTSEERSSSPSSGTGGRFRRRAGPRTLPPFPEWMAGQGQQFRDPKPGMGPNWIGDTVSLSRLS